MDQGLSWIFSIQHPWNLMRTMWHGQGKNKNNFKYKGYPYMSNMRKTMVDFLDDLGKYSGCHRMPERSFFYKGRQFPVCARCTGVCIGQLSAVIVNIFYRIPLTVSLFCLAVMGIDWSIQECGIKPSTNGRRLITGISGGFGLFSIYIAILKHIWKFLYKALPRYYNKNNKTTPSG